MDGDRGALDLATKAIAGAFPDRAAAMLDAIERAFRMTAAAGARERPCVLCGGFGLPRFPLLLPRPDQPVWLRAVVPPPPYGDDAPGAPVACLDCLIVARDEHSASLPSDTAERVLHDVLRAVRAPGSEGAERAAAAIELAFARAGMPVISRDAHPGCAICGVTRPCARGAAKGALCEDCSRNHWRAIAIDGLTGAATRALFAFRLENAVDRCRRLGAPISLLLLDVDWMKSFNDIHGFLAGDALLTRVPGIMRAELREQDLVARFGGEEFVALLEGQTVGEAADVAERIRARARESLRPPEVPLDPTEISRASFDGRLHFPEGRVSVSIGVSGRSPESAQALLQEADMRLHDAKLAGRNRVVS